MKLMTSGVTFSAAIVRSPSFSRSSSSTTTSMRPARVSSIASGMEANAISEIPLYRQWWHRLQPNVTYFFHLGPSVQGSAHRATIGPVDRIGGERGWVVGSGRRYRALSGTPVPEAGDHLHGSDPARQPARHTR